MKLNVANIFSGFCIYYFRQAFFSATVIVNKVKWILAEQKKGKFLFLN